MFVVRYLVAAFAVLIGALIGGATTGFSLWQSLGMALLAMVFLQILILGYVIVTTIRSTKTPRKASRKQTQETLAQLFILPK